MPGIAHTKPSSSVLANSFVLKTLSHQERFKGLLQSPSSCLSPCFEVHTHVAAQETRAMTWSFAKKVHSAGMENYGYLPASGRLIFGDLLAINTWAQISVTASPDISLIAVARPRNWEPACGTERSAASAKEMGVPPGNSSRGTAGLAPNRTSTVRRRVRHPRTPGRPAISVVAASDS
jgi:hypothetical protein